MDWYRNTLYRVYKWYRNIGGDRSLPESWSVIIFLMCHYANAVTVLLLYWKIENKDAPWLVSAGQTLIVVGAIVSIIYCLYFIPELRRAGRASEFEEFALKRSSADIALICYVALSIASFFGAIAYVALTA